MAKITVKKTVKPPVCISCRISRIATFAVLGFYLIWFIKSLFV